MDFIEINSGDPIYFEDTIDQNGEKEENGKPFKCQRPGCKAAFCNKGNLRRHIVEVHEGKKRSDTSFISKEQPEEESFDFADTPYSMKAKKSNNAGDGTYKCLPCNFETKYSQNLQAHFKTLKHLGNTRMSCEESHTLLFLQI